MRKAAVAIAAVVLVLALVVLLVPRFVSLDSLRPRIVAVLEEKTGRQVSLERISLALFPGIGIRIAGLTVSGDPPDPDEPLFTVPEGEVRVALGPLFSGRAEFTRFILKRPVIHFHTRRDGTHSAVDLLNRLAEREPPPLPVPGAPEEKVRVALRSFAVEEAVLSLRMETPDGGEARWDVGPLSARLSGIGRDRHDFELRTRIEGAVRGEISLAGSAEREKGEIVDPSAFHLSAKGDLLGQEVAVEGRISAPQQSPDLDLVATLPRIRMDRIAGTFPAAPAWLPALRLEGLGSVVARVSGTLQAFGFEAEADLTKAGWRIASGGRKYIDTPFHLLAQGHRFPDLVVISNAELRTPPVLLIANASLAPGTGMREWSFSSRVGSLAELSKARGGLLEEWSLSGRLTVSGRGRRERADARERFTLLADLGDVGVSVPGRRLEFRSLSGHAELGDRALEFSPLAGLVNGQRFSLSGRSTLGPRPEGSVSLRMDFLDLDALVPPGEAPKAPGTGTGAAGTAGGKGKEKAAEKEGKIVARLSAQIRAGRGRGLEFSDLVGSGRYEGGNLYLESVRARMYGGEVSVSGHVGLADLPPDFQGTVTVRDVAAEELLARKTRLGNLLSGKATLSAELRGEMADFGSFARTAAGSGSLRVSGGRIRNLDLASTAAALSGLPVAPGKEGTVPGGGVAGETPFREFGAEFRIGEGKIRTDSLRLISDRLGLSGAGAVGFDRTLEFRGLLRLPAGTAGRLGIAAGKFLPGSGGETVIPLIVSGPVERPAVAVDVEALAKGAAGALLKDLAERVAPPEAGPSGGPGPEKAPEERPSSPLREAEGLFRKLLEKK